MPDHNHGARAPPQRDGVASAGLEGTALPRNSAAAPSPADALRSLRGRGARSPAVASLFVAPGRLPDSVAAVAGDMPVAAPLSTATAFVELLLLRAAEPAIAR